MKGGYQQLGAAAGLMLLTAIALFVLAGLGVGALLGAPAPMAIGGGAIGVIVGFWIVYSRFKDI